MREAGPCLLLLEMAGTEESVVTPAPVPESSSGLRLRPVKVNRAGDTAERSDHGVPNKNFLQETWDDEPMTPAGRVFTEMSSTFVCVCILGFKNPIDTHKFKSHLELTLMKHKRFSSRVVSSLSSAWLENWFISIPFATLLSMCSPLLFSYTLSTLLCWVPLSLL